MPTLKKRTKQNTFTKFLVIVLGFLCCIGVIGFFFFESLPIKPSKEELKFAEAEKVRVINHIKNNFSKKVVTTRPVYLYTKAESHYKSVAQIASGMDLVLEDIIVEDVKDEFLKIEGSDLYVRANHLQVKDFTKDQQAMIPFNKNVITKASYELKDERGTRIGQFERSDSLAILKKLDNGYMIKFQGDYGIIEKEDVEQLVVHQNTTEKSATEIPVFMYHFFFDASKGETGQNLYWVEKDKFEQQIRYLKENDYHVLTMQELELFIDGKVNFPQKSVALTIDNGNNSVYQYAYPILKKHGIPATMFVVTGWQKTETLSESMREMKANGINLQSHSNKLHEKDCGLNKKEARLICWDRDKVVEDFKTSLDYVEDGHYLAYPFGAFKDESKSRVKEAGIKMAFLTRSDKVHVGQDKYAVPRICAVKDLSFEHFIQYLKHQ